MNNNFPKVSILVATFNRKKVFLESLKGMMNIDYPNYEVVIADNASTDGLPEDVKNDFLPKYSNIKLVENSVNLGINGGRTAAQNAADGMYFLFIDSDVFLKEDVLSVSIDYFEKNKDVGAIIPKIYYWENKKKIWCAGTTLSLLTSIPKNIGVGEYDKGQYDLIRNSTHGPGGFFINGEIARKVGGHDEKYFLCYADTDLTFKVIEEGYKVIYLPSAIIYHDIKQSEIKSELTHYGFDNKKRTYYYARNRFIFMRNHSKLYKLIIFSLFISHIFSVYYVYHIIRLKGWHVLKPYLNGVFDGWKYLLFRKWDNTKY